jgi:cardiolipin synthase
VVFFVAAIGAFVVLGLLFLSVLFEPGLAYKVPANVPAPDSDALIRVVTALSDAQMRRGCGVEVFPEATTFYPAELEAIAAAESSVHLEAYIFRDGVNAQKLLALLTERARAGVSVKLVLDSFGNLFVPKKIFADLIAAGGRVVWYQPVAWSSIKRYNNRTHRELLIIDGKVGFCGGAGIADWWTGDHGKPAWRDSMYKVTGDLALSLQTTFSENWLEASGEILLVEADFPRLPPGDGDGEAGPTEGTKGFVVASTPTAGRSTRARILFQSLIAASRESITINSPYFVPDGSTRRELVRAVQRGVRVRIVTPGKLNNHGMTRRLSRRTYGDLLKAGVEISEYQPAMIHRKALVVDSLWCVVGSTNFDNRSFGLNDEVNLAVIDRDLAERLGEVFARDLAGSVRITYEEWARRPYLERILALFGLVFARQA